MNNWSIDYNKRIIYLSNELTNSDLVNLFLTLNSNDKMTIDGPNAKWIIVSISNLN